MMKVPSLLERLWQQLPPAVAEALRLTLRLAQERKLALFLVGGSVRDLLLDREGLDIDLVVEGDAVELARALAATTGGRIVAHHHFGTSEVTGPAFALDLATARYEVYPHPGSLPRVQPSTIQDDLARRDFTVNAMALVLSGEQQGQLLDPFEGQRDLEQRLIRVLHDACFIDDATRILRAVRYEARLGFRIESHTEALIRAHTGYLDTISNARIRRELILMLAEAEPECALLRCEGLGVLAAIHPAFHFSRAIASAFGQVRCEVPPAEQKHTYLALLAVALSPAEAQGVASRLALSKLERQVFVAAARLPALAKELESDAMAPSAIVQLLEPYPAPSLWAWTLANDERPAADRVRLYLQEWRWVKPSLNGRALQHLGVPQGELMGRILRKLWQAKLDGHAPTKEDEKELVSQLLRRWSQETVLVEQ